MTIRSLMVAASALRVVNEYTVVLPQRYRARVLGVVAGRGDELVILLRDLEPGDDGELRPVWRLYRYEAPGSVAHEIARFTQPAQDAGAAVLLARDHADDGSGIVYLLFGSQLLRVDVEERTVHGVCRIHLPERDGRQAEIRGMVVRRGVVAVTVDLGVEELVLHWIPFDERGPVGCRYLGERGERLAFADDGALVALDLMELALYRDGRPVARRDLSGAVDGWYKSPTELLCVLGDGTVLAGCGDRLLRVSADLADVRGTLQLPGPVDQIAADGDGRLLLTRVDEVACTLSIRTVFLDFARV